MAITIAVCAFQAEQTIARALLSARDANADEIILLDHVTDNTIAIAKSLAIKNLRIIPQPQRLSLGAARNEILRHIRTSHTMFLDADDTITPDSVKVFNQKLGEQKTPILYGDYNIITPENQVQPTHIPAFLHGANGAGYEWERSWVATDTSFVVDSKIARKIGFKTHSAENYFFKLRALAGGHKIGYANHITYNYYLHGNAMSARQTQMLNQYHYQLARLSPRHLENILGQTSLPAPLQGWVKASFALLRGQFALSAQLCQKILQKYAGQCHDIIHPGYQCPLYQLCEFVIISAHLKMGNPFGIIIKPEYLSSPNPALINNLGVYFHWMGDKKMAVDLWQRAQDLKPQYQDAQKNLQIGRGDNITLLPFRAQYSIIR